MKFKFFLIVLIAAQSAFAMDNELQNRLDRLSKYFGQKEYNIQGNKVIASEWKSDSWLDYFNPFASKNNGRYYKNYTRISNSQELSKVLFKDKDSSCSECMNCTFLGCSDCMKSAGACGALMCGGHKECLICAIICCSCSTVPAYLGSYKKKKIFGKSDVYIDKKIEETAKLYRELQNPPTQNSIV